jgi:hypothetical protein
MSWEVRWDLYGSEMESGVLTRNGRSAYNVVRLVKAAPLRMCRRS